MVNFHILAHDIREPHQREYRDRQVHIFSNDIYIECAEDYAITELVGIIDEFHKEVESGLDEKKALEGLVKKFMGYYDDWKNWKDWLPFYGLWDVIIKDKYGDRISPDYRAAVVLGQLAMDGLIIDGLFIAAYTYFTHEQVAWNDLAFLGSVTLPFVFWYTGSYYINRWRQSRR